MNILAGLLVVAVAIIRAVALNRLPKKVFLLLWGIVLCRLFIPVTIPLRFSFYSVARDVSRMISPDNAILSTFESVTSKGGMVVMGTTAQPPTHVTHAVIIWLAGLIAALIFFVVIHIKNHRYLRFATQASVNAFVNTWLSEHMLLRPITIMQSDRITAPLAVGLIKPRIILPTSVNMDDKQLMCYVLTHEYYHIKRCDAIWKLLFVFALCVHWFNPMVWLMFVLVNRDLELTCDEMVIHHFGVDTKETYAYSLIELAEQRSKFAPLYNGFSRNATEERIKSIMKTKKTTIWAVIIAVLLVAGATTVFAALSTPDRNVDSNLPDGYESEVLLETDYTSWEDEPIEVDSSVGILVAVNRNDEKKYSPEEWAAILNKVDKGEILFFETLEEEAAYFHGASSN